jgi:hypothetical protein
MPNLNSRAIRLVDNARLVNQIAALERRTSRGGKDSIDHSPGAHDDVANVVAGLAHCAVNRHSASARSCGFSEAFLAYRSCVFAAGIG